MTQRLDYTTIAAAGMKALGGVYGYVSRSGLPASLIDLVYLRVSQINGCAYCIDMHSRDLTKGGMALNKLVLVSVWPEDRQPVHRAGTRRPAVGRDGGAGWRKPPFPTRSSSGCRPFLGEGIGRSDHRDRPDERPRPHRHQLSPPPDAAAH